MLMVFMSSVTKLKQGGSLYQRSRSMSAKPSMPSNKLYVEAHPQNSCPGKELPWQGAALARSCPAQTLASFFARILASFFAWISKSFLAQTLASFFAWILASFFAWISKSLYAWILVSYFAWILAHFFSWISKSYFTWILLTIFAWILKPLFAWISKSFFAQNLASFFAWIYSLCEISSVCRMLVCVQPDFVGHVLFHLENPDGQCILDLFTSETNLEKKVHCAQREKSGFELGH